MENALKVRDIGSLEAWAPRQHAESYDNVGLLVGSMDAAVTQVMVSLDCTEAVVEEAVEAGCQMVVSHHPLIFKGLKRLTGSNEVERTAMLALRQRRAVRDSHQFGQREIWGQLDVGHVGGLQPHSLSILRPMGADLEKWTVFVPHAHLDSVRIAMADAGAGHIGRYDQCASDARGGHVPRTRGSESVCGCHRRASP